MAKLIILKFRSESKGWLQDVLSENEVWNRIDQREKESKDGRYFHSNSEDNDGVLQIIF